MLKIEPLGDGSYGWIHGLNGGKGQFRIDIQPLRRHGSRVEAGAFVDFVNLEGSEGINLNKDDDKNEIFLLQPSLIMYITKWAEDNGLGRLGPPNGKLF